MLMVNCALVGISSNGMESIPHIVTIYKNYDFKTFLLVASVRHPQHMVEAALADGHTLYHAVFDFLATGQTPLTDLGVKKFLADWNAQLQK